MVAAPKERFTIEEFIDFDKNSEERWEYFDGVVVSMSGGTIVHNWIATNLIAGLPGKHSRKDARSWRGTCASKFPKRRLIDMPTS